MNASVSLVDYNDSDSANSSSGDEQELTKTIFQEQVKFFCQMKDFLLSQQMALRQQLAALNFKVAKKRRPPPRRRRPVIDSSNSSSSHIPNISAPNKDDEQEPEIHPDIQQFFSCSSADKSDYFKLCPICGLELETQENPEALEEHVAAHWGTGAFQSNQSPV